MSTAQIIDVLKRHDDTLKEHDSKIDTLLNNSYSNDINNNKEQLISIKKDIRDTKGCLGN